MRDRWRRLVGLLLRIGEYPGESPEQGTKRRIFVIASVIAPTLTLLFIPQLLAAGHHLEAARSAIVASASLPILVLLAFRPSWFSYLVNATFSIVTLGNIVKVWLFGGLLESGLEVIFGLVVALAALLILGRRAAIVWTGVFVATLVFAVAISEALEPTYVDEAASVTTAMNLVAFTIVVMAIVLFFVRQRDRFQKESDDLLHNILPDEIATRLKTDTSMIADDFPHASVLFADVAGFTPMSATMTPPELVGLLNQVFTTFDGFVDELGLEKIKTIGDEYMVAAGVPVVREDHAEAIAELALRIRDHMASNDFSGRRLELRIGIHSGPVVAGIIGTHKFAYDLWGDTVNTASRMESGGIAGQIQVSPATHDLLTGNGYHFEPRGAIEVKGKGVMNTWLLVGRTRP